MACLDMDSRVFSASGINAPDLEQIYDYVVLLASASFVCQHRCFLRKLINTLKEIKILSFFHYNLLAVFIFFLV